MKHLSAIAAVLLVIGSTISGCAVRVPDPADPEWITLLDGKWEGTLVNWERVGGANWRREGGVVQADKRTGKTHGYLVSKNAYTNFQLRAEFWVTSQTNSGIFIRCSDPKKIGSATAYEVNIWDTRPDPSYGTGAIVDVATVNPMPKAGGRWNTFEILAEGPRLSVWVNGTLTVDTENSKFASGPIALQYGSGVVKFRKVQIRPF